jgi:predicted HicB family RNase H-like nuclease
MILKEKIMVRMTTKDKQQLSERAAEKRLPLSTYVRYKVLKDA